jgi:TRAP transporter 4TM/12TM fusion protein
MGGNMSKKDNINVAELEDEGLPKRELTGIWQKAIFIIGLAMSVFHIYGLTIRPMSPGIICYGHVGFGIILTLALYCGTKKALRNSIPVYDLILMGLAVFVSLYLIIEQEELIYRIGIYPTPMDLIVGALLIILVLEVTRRTCGYILPGIAIAFLIYAHFGKYLPGFMGHRGYSAAKIISYMTSLDAIFSTPISASATMVFLFIVFGAFLDASGSGKFFIDFALSVSGKKRGGPAKVAVISSALFGTVSGNSVANVVSTGSYTIPLMKSVGYRPAFAGGVEATASTGGQIMPPILGSAAFIMAQLISEPYGRIVTASIIPAILYFYTVFLMVDIEAIKYNLTGLPKEKLPDFKYVATKQGYLILPLIVLIVVLSVLNASPIRAAIWGIVTAIAVTYVSKDNRMGVKKVLQALAKGAYNSTSVIAACATAGIVIGVLNLTGAGLKFASVVISLSHGNLLLALLFTMMACLVLGMGLPTTASYLICASVTAPALVQMGLSKLAAHMFIFYFASISSITPPVALAAFAGAALAKAKPMDTAISACKIGISAFIVPFMFAYGPALLWEGSFINIATAAITALTGTTLLSFGLQMRIFHIRINIIESSLLCIAALLLIHQGMTTDLIGIGISAAVIALKYFKNRSKTRVITNNNEDASVVDT